MRRHVFLRLSALLWLVLGLSTVSRAEVSELRCPEDETASVDPTGRFVIPDLAAAGLVQLINGGDVVNVTFQQQPPPGTVVDNLGNLTILVVAFDEAGNRLGSCTTNLLVRDTAPPDVTVDVSGLRWYGLPAFQQEFQG